MSIEGVVNSVKVKSYYASIVVQTDSEKVLIKLTDDFISNDANREKLYDLVGRKIVARGTVSLPSSRRNPGDFNYKRYLLGQNIHVICTVSKFKIEGQDVVWHVQNFLSRLKAKFYSAIMPLLSDEGFSMIAGVMFGETAFLDEEVYESFQSGGISHILAVSGLHVGLMYNVIRKLLKKNNLTTDILSILLILAYAALANFSLSVIRASIMICLKILAKHLNRKYDSLCAAAAICSVILLINPYRLYDSGLQLSFSAVFSMAIIAPWLKVKIAKLSDKIRNEKVYKVLSIVSPSLAATIGTGPITAYNFLNFSPISLLLNPIIIALTSIFLPVCLTGFCIYIILPTNISLLLLNLLSYTIDGFAKFLILISEIGNKINIFNIKTSPPLGAVILYYLLLFFFFSETRYILHRKNKLFELGIIETMLVFLGTYGPWSLDMTYSINPFDYSVASVTFLDVGQGDAIHIHQGDIDILIDGGGSYYSNIAENTLKPYLVRNGIKDIDLAIVTHEDMDHSKGIYELAEIFEVKQIIKSSDLYGENNLDTNASCIVSSLEIDGLEFLFMADADINRENYLISTNSLQKCDVLKIGHHGSASSTGEKLIETTSPTFAVISVGANNKYGHPTERVLNLLEENNIEYARTDLYGAICLRQSNDEYYVFENAARTKKWTIKKAGQ